MEPAACHQWASLPQRGTTVEKTAASTAGCMSSYSGRSPSTRTQGLLPASSLQTSLSPSHCEPVALLEHQLAAALQRGRQQQPLHSMVCDPAALIMLRRCTHSSSNSRRPDLEVCRCCLVQQQQAGSFHKLPQVRGRARGVGAEAAHQGICVGRKLLSALHRQHRIRLQGDARRCEGRHWGQGQALLEGTVTWRPVTVLFKQRTRLCGIAAWMCEAGPADLLGHLETGLPGCQ